MLQHAHEAFSAIGSWRSPLLGQAGLGLLPPFCSGASMLASGTEYMGHGLTTSIIACLTGSCCSKALYRLNDMTRVHRSWWFKMLLHFLLNGTGRAQEKYPRKAGPLPKGEWLEKATPAPSSMDNFYCFKPTFVATPRVTTNTSQAHSIKRPNSLHSCYVIASKDHSLHGCLAEEVAK